jgi:hypothetical protein
MDNSALRRINGKDGRRADAGGGGCSMVYVASLKPSVQEREPACAALPRQEREGAETLPFIAWVLWR